NSEPASPACWMEITPWSVSGAANGAVGFGDDSVTAFFGPVTVTDPRKLLPWLGSRQLNFPPPRNTHAPLAPGCTVRLHGALSKTTRCAFVSVLRHVTESFAAMVT